MRMSGESDRCISYLMFLALIILILCFAFINVLCDENNELLSISRMVDFSANSNEPLFLIKDRFYFATFISDENYNFVELERIRRKYIQYWLKFLNSICNIKIVQHMYTAILMSSFFILANIMNKRVTVIALFIGGHDPPKIGIDNSGSHLLYG